MVASIAQIIAAINPEKYAAEDKEGIKKLAKEKGILAAAEKAKPTAVPYIALPLESRSVKDKLSSSSHTLIYDSSSETLEPIYFWLMDLVKDLGFSPEKMVDNFSSTPGSGHFSEIGQKATIMQQQASKLLGDINTVVRSIINIIYDLKDFKMRLKYYDMLKSKKTSEQETAILSLKQIWLDKVDVQKQNSSIKAMSLGGSFQTLLPAFLAVKDEKEVEKLDLNDIVKRILKSRIVEFSIWLKESGEELKKRYSLEKTYLRSQVNSLKLYSRWARPYLKSAGELEQKDQSKNYNFVKMFDTIILELTLFGKRALDPKEMALSGELPPLFTKYPKDKRKYYACLLIDFNFRGIPKKIAQQSHFVFGGKTEFTIKGYALNDDEIKALNTVLEKSELNDMLELIKNTTGESMDQLQKDIDEFLEEKIEEKKEEEKSSGMGLREFFYPFLAIFGLHKKPEEPKKEENKKNKWSDKIKISEESWEEKEYLGPKASEAAAEQAFLVFDLYKKAHGMASFA